MRDELLAAIDAGDGQTCVDLLNGLDETARRALHPSVAQKLADADTAFRHDFGASRSEHLRRYTAARLALLGTATLGELKKSPNFEFRGESAYAVLTQRRPLWLADWAQFELERSAGNWVTVRALVRAGLIPKPTSDFYILGMIVKPGRHQPPRQFLEGDRGLFDDELWRLFECEGSGELSLAAYDKYVQEKNTWLEAIRSMAADGTLDRTRVLVATLDALLRDFAPFRAGWFSRLHEALKPTREERVAQRERYLDLLNSRVPATVSFAMKALVEVDKAGELNTLDVLPQLGAALQARDKGTAGRALSILSQTAQRAASVEVEELIAEVASRALGHASAEVQESALRLVDSRTELSEPYRAILATSVRARLETQATDDDTGTAATMPIAAPLSDGAQPVVPVADGEELTELFAAVLENQGPAIAIERVIDGIARMGAGERLTGSLARRAAKMLERRDRQQPRRALAELAVAWTKGLRTAPPVAEDNLADFLLWRVWCVAEQVAQHQERPLLSLPTWPDGRIDPAELARRLDELPQAAREAAEQDRASLFHLDLLQARLRAGTGSGESPPEVNLTWKKKTWEASGRTYSHHYAALDVRGSAPRNRFDPALLSTATFHASLEMKRWCATVCPSWCEGWFAAGCHDLAGNLDWWQADWSTRAYLESIVQTQEATGPMGTLLLALGLGAKEPGEGMVAVDALIALTDDGTGDGRLTAVALGRALIDAASSGAIKFARWAKQLMRASQAGPAQARTIFLALEELFESGQGASAADYFKLVELERELAHQTGLRLVRAGAIKTLQDIPTGGKTKRLIAELLK